MRWNQRHLGSASRRGQWRATAQLCVGKVFSKCSAAQVSLCASKCSTKGARGLGQGLGFIPASLQQPCQQVHSERPRCGNTPPQQPPRLRDASLNCLQPTAAVKCRSAVVDLPAPVGMVGRCSCGSLAAASCSSLSCRRCGLRRRGFRCGMHWHHLEGSMLDDRQHLNSRCTTEQGA